MDGPVLCKGARLKSNSLLRRNYCNVFEKNLWIDGTVRIWLWFEILRLCKDVFLAGLLLFQPERAPSQKQEPRKTRPQPSPQPPSVASISSRCRCGTRLDFPAKPTEEGTYWRMICPNPDCGRTVKLNCEKARRICVGSLGSVGSNPRLGSIARSGLKSKKTTLVKPTTPEARTTSETKNCTQYNRESL